MFFASQVDNCGRLPSSFSNPRCETSHPLLLHTVASHTHATVTLGVLDLGHGGAPPSSDASSLPICIQGLSPCNRPPPPSFLLGASLVWRGFEGSRSAYAEASTASLAQLLAVRWMHMGTVHSVILFILCISCAGPTAVGRAGDFPSDHFLRSKGRQTEGRKAKRALRGQGVQYDSIKVRLLRCMIFSCFHLGLIFVDG